MLFSKRVFYTLYFHRVRDDVSLNGVKKYSGAKSAGTAVEFSIIHYVSGTLLYNSSDSLCKNIIYIILADFGLK